MKNRIPFLLIPVVLLSLAGGVHAATVATGTWFQLNFTDGWDPTDKDNFNYFVGANASMNSTTGTTTSMIDSLGNEISGISLTASGWDGDSYVSGTWVSDGEPTGAPGTSTWSGDEYVNFWWDSSSSTTPTVTISGLDPTKTYNIYYYSKLSTTTSTRTHNLDINGTSQLTDTRANRWAAPGADLTFSGIALDGSDELVFNWSEGNYYNPFVSAILIETVPEPASALLLGVVCSLGFGFRRRSR